MVTVAMLKMLHNYTSRVTKGLVKLKRFCKFSPVCRLIFILFVS